MKKWLMFLILAVTPAAASSSNFDDQIAICVNQSIGYARFATMAASATDSDHGAFIAFIQEIADKNPDPKMRELIIKTGQLAWATRHMSVQTQAMHLFDLCYNSIGKRI